MTTRRATPLRRRVSLTGVGRRTPFETILPAQFFGAPGLDAERRLMIAVLADGIHCFRRYLLARNRRGRRLRQEAQEWILSDDTSWPFAFESICDALGLDPEFIRREVRRWSWEYAARRSAMVLAGRAAPPMRPRLVM